MPPAKAPLPDHLRPFVDALRQLSESDRRLVLAAARERRRATIPWEELEKMCGVARLGGGDAVEDCDRLYDEC